MSQLSNYLENKLIDHLLRGQQMVAPANVYIGLFTVAPSDAAGGTEVTGGGYTRATVASSLANWAGTQGAGTTVASSGTGGQTSNNAQIAFPSPSGNWGNIVAFGVFDAVSGGNLLFYGTLGTPKTVNNGDAAPTFAAAALTFTLA